MMALAAMFRVVFAKVKIWMGHDAKVIHAPSVEIEADSQIFADSEATVARHPATEISASKAVALSLMAKLVAYNRAAGRFIKGISVAHAANLQAFVGKVARFIKAVKVGTTAVLQSVGSAVAKRSVVIQIQSKAKGIFAPAKCTTAENECVAEVTAKTSAPEAAVMEFGEVVNIGTDAPLAAGDGVEAKSSRVVRHSLIARLVAYKRAVASHMKEIFTACLAGLTQADGIETGHQETLQVGCSSLVTDADTIGAKSRKNSFTSAHEAIGGTALTLGTGIVQKAHTAVYAVLGFRFDMGWLDPVQTGSDLYIRSAYLFWQEDGNGYFTEVFFKPVRIGDDLYIRSVQSIWTEGNEANIDTDVFYTPIQTDGDLHLRSVDLFWNDGSEGNVDTDVFLKPEQTGSDLYIRQDIFGGD